MTRTMSTTPWHTGLTGKLDWTTIGAMSRKLAHRGRAADARREHALYAYDMRRMDALLNTLEAR